MDWELFIPGAVGALLTVYIAAKEFVPPFPALYDASTKEDELTEIHERIERTRDQIDVWQERRAGEELTRAKAADLNLNVESSLKEIELERARLTDVERSVRRGQFISRGLGFLVYIGLGGFIAAVLAGRVEIDGVSGDQAGIANVAKAFIIGTAWTSYLAALGYRSTSEATDDLISNVGEQSITRINALERFLEKAYGEEEAGAKRPARGQRAENKEAVRKVRLARKHVENTVRDARTKARKAQSRLL